MGLLSSLFSRVNPDPALPAEGGNGDNLAQARTRARQRLMGAVVLVGIGIIGFPLLFETQPRPIAVDVPIEIPRKENAPPLTLPTARAPSAKPPVVPPSETPRAPLRAAEVKPAPADKPAPAMITETAAEAGLSSPAASKPAMPQAVPPKVVAKLEDKPEPKPELKAAPRPPAKPAADNSEAARAQALLEGKTGASAPSSAARFIVQIGAFADPALARETRLKVERLGLVTYTHVAKTPDGDRTRVRVGPVPTRQEADKIAARIKATGLPAAILTL